MKPLLTAAARQDLKEIHQYISSSLRNPTAAKNVVQKIISQIRSLTDFPDMGTILFVEESPIPYRYLVGGNYMSFYHIQKDSVIVDRILYGRRDYLQILLGGSLEDEEITR